MNHRTKRANEQVRADRRVRVGSDLQTVLSGSLVYNFTNWLAVSAGYKYWYFKYTDTSAAISHLEQTIMGRRSVCSSSTNVTALEAAGHERCD
jgi:hypothetical protein